LRNWKLLEGGFNTGKPLMNGKLQVLGEKVLRIKAPLDGAPFFEKASETSLSQKHGAFTTQIENR